MIESKNRLREINKAALRELIEQGGTPFIQNTRSWRLRCPKCSKHKLYVEKATGRCRCMHCQQEMSGWADYVLSHVYSYSREELTAMLFDVTPAGIELPEDDTTLTYVDHWGESETEEEIILEELPPVTVWGPDYYELDKPQSAKGVAYLANRGIPIDVAMRYGIRYCPPTQRVAFPVIVHGELRGWQARLIVPGKPKIMTEGPMGGKVLMFQDNLKNVEHGILVEGPVDAIKCDLCGGAAASMGKDITDRQIDIFLKSGIKKLYIGFDDDAAERIMDLADRLAHRIELYRLATPAHREDLGDCTFEEVYKEFINAQRMYAGQQFFYLDPNPTNCGW